VQRQLFCRLAFAHTLELAKPLWARSRIRTRSGEAILGCWRWNRLELISGYYGLPVPPLRRALPLRIPPPPSQRTFFSFSLFLPQHNTTSPTVCLVAPRFARRTSLVFLMQAQNIGYVTTVCLVAPRFARRTFLGFYLLVAHNIKSTPHVWLLRLASLGVPSSSGLMIFGVWLASAHTPALAKPLCAPLRSAPLITHIFVYYVL